MKIILGAGLSGLIYKFYHKDAIIISDNVGGKIAQNAFANTIYLHQNKYSEKLLQDLGIDYTVSIRNIQYFIDGELKDIITEEQKANIIAKKAQSNLDIKDFKLSTPSNFIIYLEFSYAKFFERITKDIEIIQGSVKSITDNQIITDQGLYNYSELISSLPAKIFWKLRGEDRDLKSQATTFIVSDKCPIKFNHHNSVLYVNDPKYVFTRINYRDGKYLYEIPGIMSEEEFLCTYPEISIITLYVDKSSFIFTDYNNLPPLNTIFIGRFANHIHNYKQEDVIKEALMNYNFSHVWYRQKSFTSKFVDFTRLEDKEYIKTISKDYILAIMDKLSSLSNHVGYKQHKPKIMNKDWCKKDIMAVFKYVLNLCLIFKIDIHEFIELFNNVSKTIEDECR